MEDKKDYWEQWLDNSKEKVKAKIVLTDEQVAEIRKDPFKYSAVKWAKKFNCSITVITNVIQNRGAYYSPDYSFTWVDGKEDNRTLVERLKERQSKKENLLTRNKRKWFTEEQIDFIRESDLSNVELAEMFNCNKATISNIINNHTHYDPYYTPKPKRKVLELNDEDLKKIRTVSYYSDQFLAKLFNTSSTFINQIRKNKVKKYYDPKYKTLKTDFPNQEDAKKFTDEEIKMIRNNPLGNRKLAKQLGVAQSTIINIRNNKTYYDSNFTPKVRFKPKLTWEDVKFIRANYLEIDTMELAKKFNVSKTQICCAIRNESFFDPDYIYVKKKYKNKDRILTDEQVLYIRKTDKYYKDVCKELDISETCFYNIKNGKTYKEVKEKSIGKPIFDKKQIEELQTNPLNRINMLWGK